MKGNKQYILEHISTLPCASARVMKDTQKATKKILTATCILDPIPHAFAAQGLLGSPF